MRSNKINNGESRRVLISDVGADEKLRTNQQIVALVQSMYHLTVKFSNMHLKMIVHFFNSRTVKLALKPRTIMDCMP